METIKKYERTLDVVLLEKTIMESCLKNHKFKQAKDVTGDIQGECLVATAELAGLKSAAQMNKKNTLLEGFFGFFVCLWEADNT